MGRNALAFAYQSKHLMGLSVWFFNPVLALLYLFSMRRFAFILFQRDCTLFYLCLCRVKNEETCKCGGVAKWWKQKICFCRAIMHGQFGFKLPRLDLFVHRSYQHNTYNAHNLLVNKNKANAFNTSLAWRIAADLLITVWSFLMSGFICISECMISPAFCFCCGFKLYSNIWNFLTDLQVEK